MPALRPRQTCRAFDLQGHRGARGLAPENTLAGFAKALEIRVTTLETDLAIGKDGVLDLARFIDMGVVGQITDYRTVRATR